MHSRLRLFVGRYDGSSDRSAPLTLQRGLLLLDVAVDCICTLYPFDANVSSVANLGLKLCPPLSGFTFNKRLEKGLHTHSQCCSWSEVSAVSVSDFLARCVYHCQGDPHGLVHLPHPSRRTA